MTNQPPRPAGRGRAWTESKGMAKPGTHGDGERMARARRIASNPAAYKVCEGCDSIVAAAAVLCPNCHSYRFDADAEHIVDQALRIGARAQRSVTAEDLG